MAIIDLQRRLVQVGRIRMGASEEREREGGGTFKVPKRLGTWRLTSRDQARLVAAAQHYGGEVQPWDGHEGEYVLDTTVDTLPVAVLPGQNLSVWYEHWDKRSKAKRAPIECIRRCDGQVETLTDKPCLCDPDERLCKPRTRLSVLLTEVPGIGCWRFDSSGWYAAIELSGTADLLEACTAAGRPYPAQLRIDQRKGVKDGERTTFPVPVLDIATTLGEALATLGTAVPGALPAAAAQLPPAPGHTPLPLVEGAGVGMAAGLAAAAAQVEPRAVTGRSAEPLGPPAIEAPLTGAQPLVIDEGGPDPGSLAPPHGAAVGSPGAAAAKQDFPPAAASPPPALEAEAELDWGDSAEDVVELPIEDGPGDHDARTAPMAPTADASGAVKDVTAPQKKKLNVLVGKLRDGGHLTTQHLYMALAGPRKMEVEVMAELIEGRDAEGELHWAPLRDTLTREEAHDLISRLEAMAQTRGVG